ncbi:MAG TPA: N-acetyltransferase [Puia sp.]|nr:N-acetyltransferase [Puia sp.]
MIKIRKAQPSDADEIWNIIEPVINAGDTYTFAPGSSKEKMVSYWLGHDKHSYVAMLDGKIAGTFIMKDNQPGLGSHIANASYMVHPDYAGRGLGKAMGEFSIMEAKHLNYHAMQFNIVIKTNESAVALWKKLGFEIIGEIPDAFNHIRYGLTNAYIMYRKL